MPTLRSKLGTALLLLLILPALPAGAQKILSLEEEEEGGAAAASPSPTMTALPAAAVSAPAALPTATPAPAVIPVVATAVPIAATAVPTWAAAVPEGEVQDVQVELQVEDRRLPGGAPGSGFSRPGAGTGQGPLSEEEAALAAVPDVAGDSGQGLAQEEEALVFEEGPSRELNVKLPWLERYGLPLGPGPLEGIVGALTGEIREGLSLMVGRPAALALVRDKELKVGETYAVVRRSEPLSLPGSRVLGQSLRVVGFLKIESLGTGTATALLKNTWDPVLPGDLVQELSFWQKALDEVNQGSPALRQGRIRARVAALANGRSLAGEGDALLLDRGSAAGLKPGLRFTLRSNAENSKESEAGEAETLLVRGGLCLARVIRATRAIKAGDGALLSAAP